MAEKDTLTLTLDAEIIWKKYKVLKYESRLQDEADCLWDVWIALCDYLALKQNLDALLQAKLKEVEERARKAHDRGIL